VIYTGGVERLEDWMGRQRIRLPRLAALRYIPKLNCLPERRFDSGTSPREWESNKHFIGNLIVSA
jgi:hypothetical protein